MMAGLTFNLVLVVAYVVFGTLMSLCLLLEWADNSNREQKSSMKEKERRNSVLSQDQNTTSRRILPNQPAPQPRQDFNQLQLQYLGIEANPDSIHVRQSSAPARPRNPYAGGVSMRINSKSMTKSIIDMKQHCTTEMISKENNCAVCLDPFEVSQQVVPLKCNPSHLFHRDCLVAWTKTSYQCPICREPIIDKEADIEAYKRLAILNTMNMFEDVIHEAEIIDK